MLSFLAWGAVTVRDPLEVDIKPKFAKDSPGDGINLCVSLAILYVNRHNSELTSLLQIPIFAKTIFSNC